MSSLEMPVENLSSRRDLPLEDAFLQATDSTIVFPNALQRALFPRLSTQDTGILVQTGPGAGRLEAVYVPAVIGAKNDDQPHRLYIIAPDNSLLDDYVYRLVPYTRALSAARGVPVTLFVDDDEPFVRRYRSDGSYADDVAAHPLDIGVDLAVTRFSAFRRLFFGAGGVHALPGKLERTGDSGVQWEMRRRDLFYFDEAQSYDREEFTGFVKLIEFLYAEDLDIVVGATTLPEPCVEELSFLENLIVDGALHQPLRTIVNIQAQEGREIEVTVQLIKERYFESSRAGVVCDTPQEAEQIFEKLSSLYPQLVYVYHSGQEANVRARTYAMLRELEKEGEGYLLITDGRAIETADIDVNLLLTSACSPEQLIRRAGRCNRRGDLRCGEIFVIGDAYVGRSLPDARQQSYVETLSTMNRATEFEPDDWKSFIV
jgi:CRISPR-associated endonuclease/helicase Cas3